MATKYPTKSWPDVVTFYRELGEQNAVYKPMQQFVAQLASSPFAAGLYPYTSMAALLLYQQNFVESFMDHIFVDFQSHEFVVRYYSGKAFHGLNSRFRADSTPGLWTKRGPDGMVLLKRLLHHLHWFTEYRSDSC